MIYLDSSVVLSILFAEDRQPPDSLRSQPLTSSQLLEFECLNRAHARPVRSDGLIWLDAFLKEIGLIAMDRATIRRALEPWPARVRTLDSIHLATALHLRENGAEVSFATYDRRLADACSAVGLPLYSVESYP